MPRLFGNYTAPLGATPPGLVDGSVQGGRVRVYREKITLAGQTTADTVVLAVPSAGETFLCGTITSDISLGAAQIAIVAGDVVDLQDQVAQHFLVAASGRVEADLRRRRAGAQRGRIPRGRNLEEPAGLGVNLRGARELAVP